MQYMLGKISQVPLERLVQIMCMRLYGTHLHERIGTISDARHRLSWLFMQLSK